MKLVLQVGFGFSVRPEVSDEERLYRVLFYAIKTRQEEESSIYSKNEK